MLSMQNISKVYRADLVETHALREFSLEVKEGEFISVTGPSGSGKTTFLNIAGLLESFTSGRYELDGRDVSSLSDSESSKVRNEKIGFVFQSFNLIPDLNLFDNVDVPLRYRGFNSAPLACPSMTTSSSISFRVNNSTLPLPTCMLSALIAPSKSCCPVCPLA